MEIKPPKEHTIQNKKFIQVKPLFRKRKLTGNIFGITLNPLRNDQEEVAAVL